MKYATLEEILEIKQLLNEKNERIAALEKMLDDVTARYMSMTDAQLKEAIRDIEGTRKEIAEEKKWCEWAKAKIRKFYRPAIL